MSGAFFPQQNTINSHTVKGKDDEASIASAFLLGKDSVKQCFPVMVGGRFEQAFHSAHPAQVVFGEQRLVLPLLGSFEFIGFGCFSLLGEEECSGRCNSEVF